MVDLRPYATDGGDQRFDQPGQGALQLTNRHRLLQQPQPGENRQRVVAVAQGPDGGDRAVAGQGGVRLCPDQVHHAVDPVVEVEEGSCHLGPHLP